MQALFEAVSGIDGAVTRDPVSVRSDVLLSPDERSALETSALNATRSALRFVGADGRMRLTYHDTKGRAVTGRLDQIPAVELLVIAASDENKLRAEGNGTGNTTPIKDAVIGTIQRGRSMRTGLSGVVAMCQNRGLPMELCAAAEAMIAAMDERDLPMLRSMDAETVADTLMTAMPKAKKWSGDRLKDYFLSMADKAYQEHLEDVMSGSSGRSLYEFTAASVSEVEQFFVRGMREADADLPDGYELVLKDGSKDYWYLKKGDVVKGVVSTSKGGDYDADTKADGSSKGGDDFKQGFGSPEEAAKWILSKTEAQTVAPALAFGDEEPGTKPGAFKVSSQILKLWKTDAGMGPADMLFKRVRERIAQADRASLGLMWGIKDDPNLADTQDFIAGKPRAAFNKWLLHVHKVDPKMGVYIRQHPDLSSLIYLLYMARVSGNDMARIIFKRYFETDSDHPDKFIDRMKKKGMEVEALDPKTAIDLLRRASAASATAYQMAAMSGEDEEDCAKLLDKMAKDGFLHKKVQQLQGGEERVVYQLGEEHMTEGMVANRIFTDTFRSDAGDFRSNGWPSNAVYSFRVYGNTFPIKNELKRYGMKFNPRDKSWSITNEVSTYGLVKGAVPEAKVDIAREKLTKLVNDFNNSQVDANKGKIAGMGLGGEEPFDPKKLASDIRRSLRMDRYGIEISYSHGAGPLQTKLLFSGDTFPLKDLFKKVGFDWDARSRRWEIMATEYKTFRRKFEADALKLLKQVRGDRPAPGSTSSDPSLQDRLNAKKQRYEYESVDVDSVRGALQRTRGMRASAEMLASEMGEDPKDVAKALSAMEKAGTASVDSSTGEDVYQLVSASGKAEDIQVINPYANGMWTIRVEDLLMKATKRTWTWKKPILKIGKNVLIYKWNSSGAMATLKVEYDEASDLFNVETKVVDKNMKVVGQNKIDGVYIDQVTDPKVIFGWAERKKLQF